ncbi:UvrD-helicase domain-containing protein [Candidatus Saccharibacteria bacterium]|nr:UvrD-helicase domain-containing protein [Candidatus Saccharibacteria bacterium]
MTPKTLQSWFKSHIKDQGKPYTLDKDQAKIVLDAHKNALVTARAGSGKTRTVVAKVVYLIAYEKIPPENIIIFAFNRKAKTEINERLAQITCDDQPLFQAPTTPGAEPAKSTKPTKLPDLATTFHAFAYKILDGENTIVTEAESNQIILNALETHLEIPQKTAKEQCQKRLSSAKQFIARAEQQFFGDYTKLDEKIAKITNTHAKNTLKLFEKVLRDYHAALEFGNKVNFNQLIAKACGKLPRKTDYQYIFIDEYQDFSLLFLALIKSLRKTCKTAKLLAVGDDWQAINRFAGGNVEYFQNFEKYFPEDSKKLFIPTNYRSGKRIVKNANHFMGASLKDFNGCKAGNKLKSKIFLGNISNVKIPLHECYELSGKCHDRQKCHTSSEKSEKLLIFQQYKRAVESIIAKNPGKSIKILARNNDLSFMPLRDFCTKLELDAKPNAKLEPNTKPNLTACTIHKSKGLEADVIILLEIDAGQFPGPDKSGGLYEIFGDNEKTLLEDEHRLFYVALTRAKEKLYILTKTTAIEKSTKKYNFLSYLNEDFLDPLF